MENHRLASMATVRTIEAHARSSLPEGELMRRAGAAAGRRIVDCLTSAGHSTGQIVVLVGPGDNGVDGRIVADELRQSGYTVDTILGNDSKLSQGPQIQSQLSTPSSASGFLGPLPASGSERSNGSTGRLNPPFGLHWMSRLASMRIPAQSLDRSLCVPT